MKSTHEEFIKLQSGHAFITGVPDKCDHDDKETIYTMGNGLTLPRFRALCPTDEATWEFVQKWAERHNTYCNGATSGCSKCGKVFSLKDLMGDAYWL